MHVLQWLAVPVESDLEDQEAEAMQAVESKLNEQLNPGLSWFDWFVIGGGRWNPEQDPYASSSNMIISYSKNPVDFQAKIIECIENRKREFTEYRESLAKNEIDINAELDKYDGNMDYSFSLYPVGKMIDMLQGNWDFNSYFFDAEHESTNPKHMLDKLASGDVNWYLVPVDFHF